MANKIFQKLHSKHVSHLFHRSVAALLALAMTLPMLPALPAFANDEGPVTPPTETPVVPTVTYVAPTITVEANAVVDRWYDPDSKAMQVKDYLTGDLEVAIRVKTGTDTAEGAVAAFNTIGVALKYDNTILTPYSWTLVDGIDTAGQTVPSDDKKKAAQEVDLIGTTPPFADMTNMQTLKSKKVTEATAHVSGGDDGGYLYFYVQSDRPITLENDTILAVVTFRYDKEKYTFDAKADGAGNWLTPSATGDYKCLLKLATSVELAGHYSDYPVAYGPDKGDEYTYMYYTETGAPATGTALELNTVYGTVVEGKINFELVNHTTYNDSGLSLDDMATVLFYDWDDTLIGVLTIPRDGDARKLVNDYVRDHMIHPDLRYGDGTSKGVTLKPDADLVTSLERQHTYRGKYPINPMTEEEAKEDHTADPNGVYYPLTNKLDYVFMKRPMTKDISVDTNTWVQPGTKDKAEWDTDFPYIHGWAVVPVDERPEEVEPGIAIKAHPDQTWGTVGVGTLSDFPGLLDGGYQRDYYTDEPSLNPGAVDLTSTDSNFTIADFNFRGDAALEPGAVYAVEAIYEPGADLLYAGYTYRMISEPYYNKKNDSSAANGGAYSVEMLYERANVSDFDADLCGVARAVDLQLRQETTADLKWENEYLVNATVGEQASKTKTTYSTGPVDNMDEVGIELVLSARQNKVDYFLMEAYGASFVNGGARSLTNRDYTGSAHVADNYNYKTADNNTDPIYYQAEYIDTDGDGVVNDDRSGTYGFVLFGTLNNLGQKVGEYNAGTLSATEYGNYMSIDNFNDINLRVDNEAVTILNRTAVRNAWRAAVTVAQEAHKSGNNMWWNVEYDHAEFTYHQIQWFVTYYVKEYGEETTFITDDAHMANYRAWLLDDKTADDEAHIISWCNLHEECASSRSGKPNSFLKMVKAAWEGKKDTLLLLTLDEAENYAHLRANEQGTAYGSISRLADALIDAVQGLKALGYWSANTDKDGNLTLTEIDDDGWDAIQGWILAGSGTSAADLIKKSRDTAWWNKGDPAPSASRFTDLLAAVEKTIKTGRDAWINYYRYRNAFNDMKANGTSPENQWTRITENLVAKDDGTPFKEYADFVAIMKEAFPKLGYDLGNEYTEPEGEEPPQLVDNLWNRYQYYILNKTVPADDKANKEEYAKYWWHNGYSRITDLASLFVAAQQYRAGNTTVWDMFDKIDMLYDTKDAPQLQFRKGIHGINDKYTDIGEFKTAVLAFIQKNGANVNTGNTNWNWSDAWNQLQYYLIHQIENPDLTARATNEAITEESPYYWWKNGKDGEAYTLRPGTGEGEDSSIESLGVAIYSAHFTGNPRALEQLTVAAVSSETGSFRLIPSYTGGEETWADLTKYDSSTLPTLKEKLMELAQKASTEAACKNLTWRQVQHYLLTNTYLSADSPQLPTDSPTDKDGTVKNYWWKQGSANPNLVTDIKTDLDTFLDIVDQYIAGTYEEDIEEIINLYFGLEEGEGTYLNLYSGGDGEEPYPVEGLTGRQQGPYRAKFLELFDKVGEVEVPAATLLDWFVLQYYSFSGNSVEDEIVSKNEAKEFYLMILEEYEMENWAPSYVDVPDGYALSGDNAVRISANYPNTKVVTDEETGVTTVTTTVTTKLDGGLTLTVKTVVDIYPDGTTVTTVTTTLTDKAGNILSQTVTSDVGRDDPGAPSDEDKPAGDGDYSIGDDTNIVDVVPDNGDSDDADVDDLLPPLDIPVMPVPTDPEDDPDVESDDPGGPVNPLPPLDIPIVELPVGPDDPGGPVSPLPSLDIPIMELPVGPDDSGGPSGPASENLPLDTNLLSYYTDDRRIMSTNRDIAPIRGLLARFRLLTTDVTPLNAPVISVESIPIPWLNYLTTFVTILEGRLI